MFLLVYRNDETSLQENLLSFIFPSLFSFFISPSLYFFKINVSFFTWKKCFISKSGPYLLVQSHTLNYRISTVIKLFSIEL